MDVLLRAPAQQRIKSLFLLYLFTARTLGVCPRPTLEGTMILSDAALLINEYQDNDVITLACANGYIQDSGSATIKCIDGAWGDPDLICKKKDCGPPPVQPHMIVNTSEGTLFGALATVKCEKGYLVRGPSYKQCFNSGWTGRSIKCEIVKCDVPGEITNGIHSWDSTERPQYGESIFYSCDDGYLPTGNTTIMCNEEGEFDSAPPQCLGEDILRDADNTPTTIKSTMSNYSQGDQNDDIVDTKKDVGYTPVIISVVCVSLAACIAILFIHKLLNKRKGSYDTREDLKPELLQFQNL